MKIKQNILVAGFFISIILLTGCFIQAKPETSELESTTEETPRVFLENISPTVTDKTVLTDEQIKTGDMNGNGVLDASDYVLIKKKIMN